ISKGQRIMQGVFVKYLTTDDDNANGKRTGGFGSTGEDIMNDRQNTNAGQ
ncbi:aminotransferase, partial [Lactococcus cremoris]|nr:aminotransferase [Lactococcus cremoris]